MKHIVPIGSPCMMTKQISNIVVCKNPEPPLISLYFLFKDPDFLGLSQEFSRYSGLCLHGVQCVLEKKKMWKTKEKVAALKACVLEN